jgi:hydroxymethylbilane synthase
MILARAGVERLGLMGSVAHTIDVKDILPAPGQGAIAIEVRAGDKNILDYLSPLNDNETELSVTAERIVLKALGGGCQHPLGTYGRFEKGILTLDACYPHADSGSLVKVHYSFASNDPIELGETVARMLKEQTI